MSNEAKELLDRALTLPPDERAKLADCLFESLDSEAELGADQAWHGEIEKRVKESKQEPSQGSLGTSGAPSSR